MVGLSALADWLKCDTEPGSWGSPFLDPARNQQSQGFAPSVSIP
jgi:hypothetical protein